MRFKHILGIFTFLTCFAVSVLLVGSQVTSMRATKCFDRTRTNAPKPLFEYTETQIKIREFLEKDRQTGIELTKETVKFSREDDSLYGEKNATLNLARKMQAVNCDGLPEKFCASWVEHRNAWRHMAIFLNDDEKRTKAATYGSEKYRELNREISRTYQAMLDSAREHGVDFPY